MVWKSLKRYLGQFRIVHLNPASSTVGFFILQKMAKEIILTQGKVAIVDDDDYDYLMQWKWHILSGRYAGTNMKINGKSKSIYLHRFIMKVSKDMQVDHIDNNKLNNVKTNLRICTHTQNMINRPVYSNSKSGFKGVIFYDKLKKYIARINFNNKEYYLGCYIDPKDAARAYNEAAQKYHTEFAHLNKID
jgi:hypothetical protein